MRTSEARRFAWLSTASRRLVENWPAEPCGIVGVLIQRTRGAWPADSPPTCRRQGGNARCDERTDMSTDVDVSHFREHRTLDECKLLLHYGHVIPICHGYTATFVAENYPGWTWNELVQVFVAAGIFVNRGGAPATCDDRVADIPLLQPDRVPRRVDRRDRTRRRRGEASGERSHDGSVHDRRRGWRLRRDPWRGRAGLSTDLVDQHEGSAGTSMP